MQVTSTRPEIATTCAVELTADLTPEQAVMALHDLPGLVFLDSSHAGGERGRYSYLTADPFLTLSSRGRRIELADSRGPCLAIEGDPFDVLQQLVHRYRIEAIQGLPPFQSGIAGYFGYDLGRHLERLPCLRADDVGLPELQVGCYDWVLAWDHRLRRAWLLATGLAERTEAARRARLEQIQRRLAETPPAPMGPFSGPSRLRSNFRRATYLAAVRQAQRHIAAGDIYQVNLSQRFAGPWPGDPWPLYRRLRTVSPVPYGAYLHDGNTAILSASPECFLQFDGRRVETHPIKGTRPRGATPAKDGRLAAELRASEKDRAENLMIVDLLRNDLGKICRVGSVQVPRLFDVERYSHVWQLVSTVAGEVPPARDAVDLLRACFPGGSVTGCPKIRAMAIIEELEPVRRGIYCGAIGYLAFGGAMALSMVIRTMVLKDGHLYLQVGGAVVADSEPAREYEETLAKAAAALAALGAEVEEAS